MNNLNPKTSPDAAVTTVEYSSGEHSLLLEIPAGPNGSYRLAQLDDYAALPRRHFPWQPPLTFRLSARVSAPDLPGTWGFGLWNDPFSLSLGAGGGVRRFPCLPNAAWFFHASPENHLSFHKDKPAQGLLTQTFQSPSIPAAFFALGVPMTPLLVWPWTARVIRSILGQFIKDDSAIITLDATQWHTYTLQWVASDVFFNVDENIVFHTTVHPTGQLGVVIWIDNQYASFPPNGKLAYGTLENENPAWIEIIDIEINEGKQDNLIPTREKIDY